MPRKTEEYQLLPLLLKFISEVRRGKHIQKSGKVIKKSSLENYRHLYNLLEQYTASRGVELRLKTVTRMPQREFKAEQKYWKKFYMEFTAFLYDDLKHFDNYVTMMVKLLRSFFNYLNQEKGLDIGTFHKNFHSAGEEIEIVVLTPERLHFLTHSEEFRETLDEKLRKVKDIFVFGCTVGLRYSDLMALAPINIESLDGKVYLSVKSKKTQTQTRVKLPDYALQILERYKGPKKRLLPYYHKVYMNKYLKELMEKAGWTEPFLRRRQRRGVPVEVYKDPIKKVPYRFCDMITTHTMRRTAITTMLSLGMNEQVVRKISGHAANSKEFYRYVSFAQSYQDREIDLVHQKMGKNQSLQPENRP
jgi:integrase